jgi:hypothetical protein
MWVGEGFALDEIREILGLRSGIDDEGVRDFYVSGVGNGFYEPRPEEEK